MLNVLGSPTRLLKLGHIDNKTKTYPYEINYLTNLAFEKVVFLPFTYMMTNIVLLYFVIK